MGEARKATDTRHAVSVNTANSWFLFYILQPVQHMFPTLISYGECDWLYVCSRGSFTMLERMALKTVDIAVGALFERNESNENFVEWNAI